MDKKILFEGPDLSYHNGAVNIKQMRDNGYRRIGIRAGYGKDNVDQRYVPNAQACHNLGVDVLLYWFSYAYTVEMAAAEAGYAIAQAKKFWKKCPIAFDFEYDSVNYARKKGVAITKQLATDMAVAFLRAVRAAGYIPVVYTNRDYMHNYFDLQRIMAEIGEVYVWYARYTSTLPASEAEAADIWQYTSNGRIPGVAGNVDLNRFYTDLNDGKTEITDREEKCNINILDFQKAANADGYRDADGRRLAEDGIDGSKTQYVRKQISLRAKRAGLSWKIGSRGNIVSWWQRRCNEILGHAQNVDGLYGKITRSETIALQERLNLAQDGIAGYNSIQAVFYN